jgi:hydrogenase expression/formation protein HypE
VPVVPHERILLGHGSGGTLTARLVEGVFLPAFGNPILERLDDQALLELPGARLAFTTDSYVVTPLVFPGGDIGRLAVNGTVNDLAVGGARPLYLAAGFVLEEGLPIEDLKRVVASMREAALAAGVQIVTGDTKVVGKGKGDQVFINTSGIGVVPPGVAVSAARTRPGDAVLLSGSVGDHGMAVVAARESLGLEGAILSDTAPLHELVAALLAACPDVHAMRDPTRGGVAATLHEIAQRARVGIELSEDAVPVRDAVRGACELLGFDPLYVANEGKLVAFVPGDSAEAALAALRAHPLGREAVRLGAVTSEHPGRVVVRTAIGGSRVLEPPYGELLPRIC